jgi:hypothetical protein
MQRKYCCVAGDHMTEPPNKSPYASVVSLQSLRRVIFISELNCYEMCAGDIGNAYLESTSDEKVAFVVGSEFGATAGHVMIIKKLSMAYKILGLASTAFLPRSYMILTSFLPKLILTFGCVIAKLIGNMLQLILIAYNTLINSKYFFHSLFDIRFTLKSVCMPKYHLGHVPVTHSEGSDNTSVLSRLVTGKNVIVRPKKLPPN